MTFDAPIVVVLSPVVAVAVWFAAGWARRARIRRAAAWSEQTARIARAAGRLGSGTLGLAAGLAAVALAGPRWGEEKIVTETRGLNLVIAVDISRSMLAEDAAGSRLARALRESRRLVQDLDGDRLGLVAFAGTSYILSPLSVDGPAITLYLDALDPDMASEGGTALAPALAQGVELLRASPEVADRVLVVFTDGEGHDSLAGTMREARQLGELGIHLILVAEGGRDPARIPVRDERGALVAAELPDQAGAVRDLVASYKRATATESRTQRGRPRSWIPLLLALVVLGAQTATRRTAALVAITLCVALPARAQEAPAPAPAPAPSPPRPRSAAEKAWDQGHAVEAALAYLAELAVRQDDDTAWYNAGTASLAAGDADAARASLSRAAASLDPDVRFRALYNLGLLALAQARLDTANRDAHLADAERAYREALLLKPRHVPAKWNLELVTRMHRSSPNRPNPRPSPAPSGGAPPDETRGSGAGNPPPPGPSGGGLSEAQADQVLRSIGQEELRTRRDRTGRNRRAVAAGVKDW